MTFQQFKTIIDACLGIFKNAFIVFGYNISLWNILIFSIVAFLLLYLFFRAMA